MRLNILSGRRLITSILTHLTIFNLRHEYQNDIISPPAPIPYFTITGWLAPDYLCTPDSPYSDLMEVQVVDIAPVNKPRKPKPPPADPY
jgi:hypothetical protein